MKKRNNINKHSSTLLDNPVVFRKDIIKLAAIRSGLIVKADEELFDKFWEKYQEIVSMNNSNSVIWD